MLDKLYYNGPGGGNGHQSVFYWHLIKNRAMPNMIMYVNQTLQMASTNIIAVNVRRACLFSAGTRL